MCYPSLVFRAELPRTGNARHAKHNCGQPENSAVIVDVLIGGAFGATVGRVEIQRLRFAHASLIGASRTSPTVICSRSESPATRRNQLTLCCTPRRDKLSKM